MALTPEEQAELSMLQQEFPKLQAQFAQYEEQQQHQPQAPQPQAPQPQPEMGRLKKMGLGMGLGATETVLGAKSLFTDLSDTEKGALDLWRKDVDDAGGWATAGGIAGDVMQMAIPAKYAGTLGKALGKGAPAAVLAADATLGAGQGALQAGAREDTSRTEGAIQGALGSVLGAGVARGLTKSFRGLKESDAAKYLSDLGVKLTPAQASESGLTNVAEQAMSLMPILGKSVKAQRDQSVKTFNKAMLQQAAPDGKTISSGGQKGATELKSAFDDSYDEAWAKAKNLGFNDLASIVQTSGLEMDAVGDVGKRVKNRVFDAIKRLDASPDQTKELRNLDRVLREEGERAFQSKDWGLLDGINNIRADMTERVGTEAKEALGAINKKYGEFKTVRSAGSSGGAMERGDFGNRGEFLPTELNQAIKSVAGSGPAGKNDVFTGSAPFQRAADAATETITDNKLWAPLDAWRRVVGESTPALGSQPVMQFGADMTMGRTAGQKQLQKLSAALREQGLRGSTVGAATANEE